MAQSLSVLGLYLTNSIKRRSDVDDIFVNAGEQRMVIVRRVCHSHHHEWPHHRFHCTVVRPINYRSIVFPASLMRLAAQPASSASNNSATCWTNATSASLNQVGGFGIRPTRYSNPLTANPIINARTLGSLRTDLRKLNNQSMAFLWQVHLHPQLEYTLFRG